MHVLNEKDIIMQSQYVVSEAVIGSNFALSSNNTKEAEVSYHGLIHFFCISLMSGCMECLYCFSKIVHGANVQPTAPVIEVKMEVS